MEFRETLNSALSLDGTVSPLTLLRVSTPSAFLVTLHSMMEVKLKIVHTYSLKGRGISKNVCNSQTQSTLVLVQLRQLDKDLPNLRVAKLEKQWV